MLPLIRPSFYSHPIPFCPFHSGYPTLVPMHTLSYLSIIQAAALSLFTWLPSVHLSQSLRADLKFNLFCFIVVDDPHYLNYNGLILIIHANNSSMFLENEPPTF